MDKSKLRPATSADLVEGNKIIVEDARGALIESAAVQTLDCSTPGMVYVQGQHKTKTADRHPRAWSFDEGDFEDGRHGDYGLKLWVQTEAQNPCQSHRDLGYFFDPCCDSCPDMEAVWGRKPNIGEVFVKDAKGKYLTGKLEGVRQGKLLVRIAEEHFTTGMNSYSNRLWVIQSEDFKDDAVRSLAEVCGIKFLFAAGA